MVEDGAKLYSVTMTVCGLCLRGEKGDGDGYCYTPGCAFWMSRVPEPPVMGNCG
jgi:hypothetical protein